MALQRTRLADIQSIPTSVGSVYANPASTSTFIKSITLHNTAGTATTVTLNLVPDSGGSAGTAAAANQVLRVDLVANETLEWAPEYPIVMLDDNDTLQALASQAGATILIQGDTDV